jgi:IS30 family transposase
MKESIVEAEQDNKATLSAYLGNRLTDEQCSTIYGMLSTGASIRDAAKSTGMSKSTLLRKITDSEERLGQYRATLEAKALYHAAEIVDIADDESIPVDRAKLMVHARQWDASKILSKIGHDTGTNTPSQQVNIQATGDSRIVIQTASDVPSDPKESEGKGDSAIDV